MSKYVLKENSSTRIRRLYESTRTNGAIQHRLRELPTPTAVRLKATKIVSNDKDPDKTPLKRIF